MLDGRPTISVVMINRNDARWLSEAIRSVQSQTFTDFELVIVDDASEDDSRKIIDRECTSDNRIRKYYLEVSNGISVARNAGIDHATGRFISLLDSDDRMIPETLSKQLAYYESAKKKYDTVRLLTSDAYTINEKGKGCLRYMPREFWGKELVGDEAPLFAIQSTWFFEKSPDLRFHPAWKASDAVAFIGPIAAARGVYFVGEPLVEYRWKLSSSTTQNASFIMRAQKAAGQNNKTPNGWSSPILPDQVEKPSKAQVLGWKYSRVAQNSFFNGRPILAIGYLTLALMVEPVKTWRKVVGATDRIFRLKRAGIPQKPKRRILA